MKIEMKIIYLLISFSWVSEWSKLILTIQPQGDLITRYNNLMWINSNFVVLLFKWVKMAMKKRVVPPSVILLSSLPQKETCLWPTIDF